MATITYTSTGFTYGSSITELASKLQLALTDNTGQTFNQPFTSDSGFTYDSDKAEFTGGLVRQKDQLPTDITSGATYDATIDFEDWSNGVVTGTGYNGAGITSGKLDLSGLASKYVDYDANLNADSEQTGCAKLKWTPEYTGAPPGVQTIIEISKAAGDSDNRIRIYHTSTLLFWAISDSTGAGIVSQAETFSPTTDVEYEIELNWDVTTGATRLFINGVQLGTTHVGTGTRDSGIGLVRIGKDLNANGNANFLIDDLEFFSTVQHTSNYTPGYTTPTYKYVETKVELPQFSYSGIGAIQAYTNLATTETNAPQEIWNDLYWSGSAWVSSNGTFAQSNTKADIITNIATFPASDTLDIDVVFEDSSSIQMSMNDLTVTYTGRIYFQTDPTFETTTGINAEAISEFVATDSAAGSDTVTYILAKDDDWYYWDGAAWAESDEFIGQSNSGSDITTNIATFTSTENVVKVRGFLHSDDGSTTPDFTSIEMTYTEFVAIEFVVEDGTSKTDSTSYATVAQYKQYWKNRGTDRDATYTDAQIQGRLNLATEWIDSNYTFLGYVTDTDQALDWPRAEVPDGRGDWIDSDEIPNDIINAVCYLADQDNLVFINDGVSQESYGPVSKTYSNSGRVSYTQPNQYLKNYIVSGTPLQRVN